MAEHVVTSIFSSLSELTPRLVGLRSLAPHRLIALVVALVLSLAGPSVSHAASSATVPAVKVASADVHLDLGGLSINLALTQTRSDCGGPIDGQACLRYTIVGEDTGVPLEVGYGLIPNSALLVTRRAILLSLDTSRTAGFHHLVGSGGRITMTWVANPGSSEVINGMQTMTLSTATVAGSILRYLLAGRDGGPAVLLAPGTLRVTQGGQLRAAMLLIEDGTNGASAGAQQGSS